MYQLTAKSGLTKGVSWPIGDQPLTIGRASGCDVRIPDPVISRRHLEVALEGDRLRLANLGSLNPVIVNGRIVESAELTLGDEIRVGRYVFLVTKRESPSPSRGADDDTTGTLAEEESVFLSGRMDGKESSDPHLKSGADLNELFHISRVLSRTSTIPELTEVLRDALHAKFHADVIWLLRAQDAEEQIACLHSSEGGAKERRPDAALLDGLRSALLERRGALTSRRVQRNGMLLVRGICTAPLYLGEVRVGSIALERVTPEPVCHKRDLHFLVALAHIAAPFFKAVEYIESLEVENRRLRSIGTKRPSMVGDSQPMRNLHRLLASVAPSTQSVLIIGPTGSGKELVASRVHELSERRTGPFVTVNCAAIARELFESEFLGHEAGSFTGALGQRIGLFEQSHGGTLFLDEIGDLAPENQAKILRALETGRFRRVGGIEEVSVDFRVVSATNKELATEIREGRFREDLYYRLNMVEVRVPSLKDRPDDIPALVRLFLERAFARGNGPMRSMSDRATNLLIGLEWPGNVRELKNTVEAAYALCLSDVIDVQDLMPIVHARTRANAASGGAPLSLAEVEKEHIAKTIQFAQGNMVKTAKLLGIGRSTLYVKLAEYGLRD